MCVAYIQGTGCSAWIPLLNYLDAWKVKGLTCENRLGYHEARALRKQACARE